MEVVSYLIIVALGFAAGYLANQYLAPSAKKIADLEQQLTEEKASHEAYKASVAGHFSKTSSMFKDMTDNYRALYEHLSTGAYELCERRSIPRELATSHVNILSVEAPDLEPKLTKTEQTEATSQDKSSSLLSSAEDLVVNVTRDGMSPFDHEVEDLERTKRRSKLKSRAEKEPDSAEIINLDEQRESDAAEQAKDYAIKENGVINHNSLNRDDVKT